MIVGYYDGERSLCNQGEKQLCAAGLTRGGEQFKGLEVDVCPFVNLPEKKRTQWRLTTREMKDCMRLRPQLVAQIEFAGRSP